MASRFSTILCLTLLVSGLTGCVPYYRSPYGRAQDRQYDRDRDRDRDYDGDRDYDHDRDRDYDHDRDRDRD
jgi:hypothetical protein